MQAQRMTLLDAAPATHPGSAGSRVRLWGLLLLVACATAQPKAVAFDADSFPARAAEPAAGEPAAGEPAAGESAAGESAAGESAAGESAPKPPDLHGALIISSNYRYYAAILYGSAAQARQSALAACAADEPHAQCTVYTSFKNQCVAVAANGAHHLVATGQENWSAQQTRDFSLRLCREKAGAECRPVLVACSTQAQQAEDQSANARQKTMAGR